MPVLRPCPIPLCVLVGGLLESPENGRFRRRRDILATNTLLGLALLWWLAHDSVPVPVTFTAYRPGMLMQRTQVGNWFHAVLAPSREDKTKFGGPVA